MTKYMVEDILKHSMEIEEEGQKFYALLADRLNNAKLKNIFSIMSRQETGHYSFYKKLCEQLTVTPEAPATAEAPVNPETAVTPEAEVNPEAAVTPEAEVTTVTPGIPEIPSSDTELFDYKKHQLLEDRIFNRLDVVRKTPKIKTLGDALSFMIDIEMDVVDYFENTRKLVNPQGQAMMNKIINEEKSHVKQLVDLRQQYKSVILK